MTGNGLRIGEIAEYTGLPIPTLRHYDHLGLVTPSGRSPGGFRLYSDGDLRRLLLVRRMKPLGFTLDQMREFLEAAEILQDAGGRQGNGATQQERDRAATILAGIGDEASDRYEVLRRQLDHAREFLDLVHGLTP